MKSKRKQNNRRKTYRKQNNRRKSMRRKINRRKTYHKRNNTRKRYAKKKDKRSKKINMKGGKWTSTDYEILDELAVNRKAARQQLVFDSDTCYMCHGKLGWRNRHSCRRCGQTICGSAECAEKISFSLHGKRHINIYFCTTCKWALLGDEGVENVDYKAGRTR
jgi:hypothetical protein